MPGLLIVSGKLNHEFNNTKRTRLAVVRKILIWHCMRSRETNEYLGKLRVYHVTELTSYKSEHL